MESVPTARGMGKRLGRAGGVGGQSVRAQSSASEGLHRDAVAKALRTHRGREALARSWNLTGVGGQEVVLIEDREKAIGRPAAA